MAFVPGTVVLFKDQEGLVTALVLRVTAPRRAGAGRPAGLEMLTEKDRTLRLPENRVLAHLDRRLDPKDRRSEIVATLAGIHDEIRAAASRVDTEELWELVSEESAGPTAWQDLAGLVVSGDDTLQQAGVLEALWTDRLHFKQRKEGQFEPRRPADVAQLEEQMQAERRKAEDRERFVGLARMALAGQVPDRPGSWARPLVDLLVGLALHDEDFSAHAQARELLKDIGASGRPKDAAFDVMVALGLWEPEEELCLLRHEIPTRFSDLVLAEAEGARWVASGEALVEEPALYAIDDPETTEVDDAVGIQEIDGGLLVTVAIADLARFVEPGAALDQAALRRGRTIYLPSRKLLMIPSVLAEERASLAVGQVRPMLLFEAKLGADGHLQGFDVRRSEGRVARALSYEQADHLIGAGDEALSVEDRRVAGDLRLLRSLAEGLRRGRIEEGGLALDSDEVKVRVLGDSEVSVQRISGTSPSRLLVSESMILANRLAAAFCRDNDLPCVYQVQDPPEQDLPVRADFPSERSFFHAVRRRLKRARVSALPERHHGLGIEAYCQSSSPLRRYGDLQIEQQLGHFFATGKVLLDQEQMQRIAAVAEQTAYEASRCERESRRFWLLRHLAAQAGPLDAEVVFEEYDGSHLLELVETLVTLRIPPNGLTLGQRVMVEITKVDPRRDILKARVLD